MSRYLHIDYGDSTVGYSHAIATVGPRGGITILEHDGNPRRVTREALKSVVRDHLAGVPVLSLVTTGDDYLPVICAAPTTT